MSGIESELDEYMKKNNVQDFLNSIVLKVLEHKPENPLFYLYIQNVISKEKNEKAKYLLECYYDLMAYKGRPETEKNILPDLFHKLTTIDPHSYQDPTVSMKNIEKLTSMLLMDFPSNALKIVINNLSEDNDVNLEYDQFENVIDILLALLSLFEELKEYYEESNERSEGIGPEDICQFIEKANDENVIVLNLKSLLERSELTFDMKKFGNFADVFVQLIQQAL